MLNENTRPWTIFKNAKVLKEKLVMTEDGVTGVCKISDLDIEFINSCYGSIHFTEDFDKLPLVVRMWLTTWRWKEIVDLAKALDCDDCTDKILYSDFLEFDSESILSGPLIITNNKIAICLAPRMIVLEENFETTQETEMLPVQYTSSKSQTEVDKQ